jgi:NAD(P)-dependent dehydrogenase (short-subunit alcohol dehydrogenase family)
VSGTSALLSGQAAIVTGAGRGIGASIADRLAREGADLVLAARDVEALTATARQVEQLGRRAVVQQCDVRVDADVAAMADRALTEFGRVDLLVNNSGIGGPSGNLWELDAQAWRDTLDVNVFGAFLCCRAVLPAMVRQGSGSIVFIGSMTGKRPLLGRTPYASSKMALLGLARTLALEAGQHGIRVNLISPGPVEGDRLDWVMAAQAEVRGVSVDQVRAEFVSGAPLGRLVRTRDVADAVVFLASELSTAITGVDLNVSAGVTMY